VVGGENLTSIGAAYGLSADELARANGIQNPSQIYPGQVIHIPPAGWKAPWQQPVATPASAPATQYTVGGGDTLSGIAARYGVSVDQLAQANGIADRNRIMPGQVLRIPAGAGNPSPPLPAPVPRATRVPVYYGVPPPWTARQALSPVAVRTAQVVTVQRGDTLSGIAARLGVAEDVIASANGLLNRNRLMVGQRLQVPQINAPPILGVERPFGQLQAAPADTFVIVQPGENLTVIGARYSMVPGTIATANGIPNRNRILAGQRLRIPRASDLGGNNVIMPLPNDSGPWADASVVAPPSIGPDVIDRVLAEYGSPAQGTGTTFYALGMQYGIDPAFALAFFITESTAGTRGVAVQTRSIGNIRWTPGYANIDGFRAYASWEDGIADWYQLISEQYVHEWGLQTVGQILQRYAPPSDNNDTNAYITGVLRLVHSWGGGLAGTYGVVDPNAGPGMRANLLAHAFHVTTVFGHYADGSPHYGLDLDVGLNTEVAAPVGGTVVAIFTGCTAGNSSCGGGWGNHVWWRSAVTGHYILVAHFTQLNPALQVGTQIGAGTILGLSGTTGYSSGPHVHLQTSVTGPGNPDSFDPSWEFPWLSCGSTAPQVGAIWGFDGQCS